MTDVGKISLGVEIDASDLSARLGEAVRKAIAPALEEVNRRLEATQREYADTARASEKSSAKQAAGARAVAEAVQQIGQEQTKTAAKTAAGTQATSAAKKANDGLANSTASVSKAQRELNTAVDIFGRKSPQAEGAAKRLARAQATHTDELIRAAAESKMSTASQINDYQRLAREAELSAARQAAAQAAAGGGGGRGGGGGGAGGGGGPTDKHRGGFMQGGRGRFGFLTSPVGMNAVALGIGSLPAAATAITQVVGGIQQLAQAGLALPGIYGGAAASIGVAVAGFKGMGDAVSALNEAQKSGDPKDMEKAVEAMKDMDPAAIAVAKSVSTLARGPLLDLRKGIQSRMFRDWAGDIDAVSGKAIPRLSGSINGIADAWNGTLRTMTGAVGEDRNLGLIDRILGDTGQAQTKMNRAIAPLTHALLTLTGGGADALPRLADGLAAGAERFDKFITHASESGQLQKWINDGITGVHQLAESGLNLVKVVTDITKAAGADQGGFLKWLSEATGKLRALTSSASGQTAMAKFFRDGREQLSEWGPILVNIGKTLIEVYQASRTWTNVLLPFLRVASDLLTSMPGLVTAIGVALLAWKTSSIFKPILSGLDSMIGKMQTAAVTAEAVGGAGAVGGGRNARLAGVRGGIQKLGGARGTLGLGGMVAGAGLEATSDSGAGQLAGALTTVASGALAGSVFGPIGTGVGAGVGAAIAGVTYLLSENSKASEAAAASAEKLAAANERSHDAFVAMESATKAANDALLGSAGAFDASSISAIGDVISAIPDKLAGTLPEDTVKKIAEDMANLGMSTDQLATTVTGSGPQFDALVGRLGAMGEPGRILAEQLTSVRNEMLGISNDAAVAAPLLQTLADTGFGSVQQAAVGVANAFAAIPSDKPINVSAPGGQAVFDILTQLGQQVHVDNNKNIVVDAPLAPAVLEQLRALGHEVIVNNDKTITVRMDQQTYLDTMAKLGDLGTAYRQLFDGPMGVPAPPVPPGPAIQAPTSQNPFALPKPPGGADGMVVPGYAPGVDIYNAVLAPGEGVLIPEAVRALGGAAGIYAINSTYRSGLSKRHYADGGVNPDGSPITLPGPIGPETELTVLQQIRDLLAGKGGTASNPLAATAANTATTASATSTGSGGSGGQEIGPFGTPLKKKNRAYDGMKGFLEGLGFDAETIIGSDPMTAAAQTATTATYGSGTPGAAADTTSISTALAKFAASGDLADLAGTGLDANDSVVKAIVNARNKKKGGLDDGAISDLVTQTLGGGYTGVLDATNTPLVSALQTYREKLAKGTTTPARGTAATAGPTGVPMTALPTAMDPLSQFAASVSGGKYEWGASDLSAGLSDCSGAVSDLVEIITKGQATGERLFSTADAGSVLKSLGAVEGAIPGALQIGWSDSHMRSTLPNGVNFESGGGTGQGATYGGNAQGAAGMPNIMSLPVGNLPPGMLAGLGGAGGLGGGAGGSGTPVYVTNWPGGGGGAGAGPLDALLGGATSGINTAAGNVIGDLGKGIAGAMATPEGDRMPDAQLGQLIRERNPMALAEALGFNVQDFTRQGGQGGEIMGNEGPGYDASGRLFSDTGALMDRTLTSLNQQLQSMREQLVDVITQVQQKLESDALEPVLKAGVQSALESLKDSVSAAIGTAMGNAAGPPIADAVGTAVSNLPIDQSGAGGVGGNLAGAAGGLIGMAGGGPVSGGTPNKDSVPALLMPGEWVLNKDDVARMGGFGGVQHITSKGLRRYATGGGVIGNDTVGAEFFGVSEVPIISTIVNMLVRVLLKVIGVDIEVRDTLTEMTNDFRSFRGDAFKAFDAQGRLLNDTSGLIERSQSSEETAAAERIRILKIVIQAIIKYLIEKVIVPIMKAVANSAIQAGSSAVGMGISGAGGGPAGGIVSSLISSAGQAGVEIAAEVGTDFALAMSETLIDMVAEGFSSMFPDLMTGLFSGGAIESSIAGPLGNVLGGLLGGIMGIFTGGFGGLATVIPGIPFDNGGLAEGEGVMLKATKEPELVLNPAETDLFSRFVSALERGGFGGGSRTVHAPITVIGGGRETAEQVENRLLKLMP